MAGRMGANRENVFDNTSMKLSWKWGVVVKIFNKYVSFKMIALLFVISAILAYGNNCANNVAKVTC